ncbi:MAG: HAMP domain-containing sensor histidine kinase [Chloroflexi bacterium]|nr:HAMP domain-containing sensor histidine kinase [Chloroflexota bacterium]
MTNEGIDEQGDSINTNEAYNSIKIDKINQNSAVEVDHLEAELRLTLEEIAHLQNALADANMKMMSLQSSSTPYFQKTQNDEIFKPVLEELKQPLQTIKSYLTLLLNESVGALGSFQKRFLERISNSVTHLELLLEGLENKSKDENQDFSFPFSIFSLEKVIEDSLSLFTDLLRKKEITLRVDFPENDIEWSGDRDLFEQVLNILFSNACTSIGEEGSISISLEELKSRNPAQILFCIQSADSKSLPGKPRPLLIEEFQDESIILPGFSLPLKDFQKAHHLVKDLQGKMNILSTPGSGSIIQICLPFSRKDAGKNALSLR